MTIAIISDSIISDNARPFNMPYLTTFLVPSFCKKSKPASSSCFKVTVTLKQHSLANAEYEKIIIKKKTKMKTGSVNDKSYVLLSIHVIKH